MARTPGAKDKKPRKMSPNSRAGVPNSSVTNNLDAKKADISRIVKESYQYFGRKPPLTNEEIAERLNAYFQQCYEEGQIPTVEDMALAIGVVRNT